MTGKMPIPAAEMPRPAAEMPKPRAEEDPTPLDNYWPKHWKVRRLKPGVKQPNIVAFKQTGGPFYISRVDYPAKGYVARVYTNDRETEEEAVWFSMQFYMNETRQGKEDSEPVPEGE